MSDMHDGTAPEAVHTEAEPGAPPVPAREAWGTRLGFILAAVGSAVGLGNMWRFSYQTADAGGAAFVVLYILLTLLIGIPVMLAEFSIGRSTELSPIGALRRAGGRGWTPLGYLFVLSGFLILSYYSVIAGWVVRYALTGMLSGFPADPGAHFQAISTGPAAIGFHLAFMAATIVIVARGVRGGIERASKVMIPLLFVLLGGLAVWAATLDGAVDGYRFYLAPSVGDLFSLETFSEAAGQAFYSLSLGMGALLTFSSYLSRDESLPRESTVIALSDFGVAFVAGLLIFPVIFALGLQGAVGESPLGALFISLPGAFGELGVVGRVVGSLFFLALLLGALTSTISLLEVVTAALIDEWKVSRKPAAIGAGMLIALFGLWPAMSLDALGAIDGVASEVFLLVGGLFTAVLVGWRMKEPTDEALRGASPAFRPLLTGWIWLLRVVVPVLLCIVLWNTVPGTLDTVRALFGG